MPRSINNFSAQSKTQRARVLRLLIDAKGSWVPLPEILALGCAQFGARIFELRRLNFNIENKIERDDSGVVHSWYRLVSSPTTPAPEPLKEKIAAKDDGGVVEESRTTPRDSRQARAEWFERNFGTPAVNQPKQEEKLPLFAGVGR
jgi:hypothetical protein